MFPTPCDKLMMFVRRGRIGFIHLNIAKTVGMGGLSLQLLVIIQYTYFAQTQNTSCIPPHYQAVPPIRGSLYFITKSPHICSPIPKCVPCSPQGVTPIRGS